MVLRKMLLAGMTLVSAQLLSVAEDPSADSLHFFESEVRPLLANRCYNCHGEKKQKGGLRMDNIADIKAGGDTGPAVIAGKPEESLVVKGIRYKDPDFQMPPKEQLAPAEIAVLEKWIALGAPWPADPVGKVAGVRHGITPEDRKFWCFQPLATTAPPALPGNAWVRNEIDRFIAAKQAEMKLDPAPEADRREIARRLYFDLHGLPPTQTECDAFAASADPNAYEKLVDELLASPRYGERWAQHWLDLVRYAESDGYNQDAYRAAAWPYRDWVIKSLNDDMPYDQFVREQLAGDEIAPNDPNVIVATGYLRNGLYEYNQRDVKGQWDLILNDLTDTTGELFLGVSIGCARCHDHKFDPILQKDYYRLKSFFAPILWRDDMKLATEEEKATYAKKLAAWEEATAEIRKQIDELIGPALHKSEAGAIKKFTDDLQAIIAKPAAERDPVERQYAMICQRQIEYARHTFDPKKALKKEEEKAHYAQLESELKKFDSLKPAPLLDAFVATDACDRAPTTTFKYHKKETEANPGFLSLLDPSDLKIAPIGQSTGRRTALAEWITRADNPLSTRVIVNRVWHYHFGKGLVATPSDFGHLGEPPSHPELLDWLTRRFLAEGWSLKKLHKEILMSATYRQTAHRSTPESAARIDPGDRFLWRFPPRRLDAEQVRDAFLAASGELDLKAGGPSEDGVSNRRSIYTMKKRNSQNELLRSLDAPAGFGSTSERQSTTTPTQALLLINGDWPLARARQLAGRVASIDDAWKIVLGRPPSARERAHAEAFLDKRLGPAAAATEANQRGVNRAGEFKENTPQERLIVYAPEPEGDDFTVEAVFRLDSIDAAASVRTVASRWTGGKDNLESFGWSLGVTGEKSRFKPRNLIVQLVGEDENANIAYEIAASDLRIELHDTYHVAAKVSCAAHTVTFHVQNLTRLGAPVLTAVVPHRVHAKLSYGVSSLVIGGLNKRASTHQFDGHIDAVRIMAADASESVLSPDPSQWRQGLLNWNASAPASPEYMWSGTASKGEGVDPARQAMSDLCHVLLNTNEFFYLQ